MASTGVGALVGTIYLAARNSVVGLGKRIPLAAACFGVGLIGFSFSRHMLLSLPLIAVAGFGMMVSMASSNTILQTIAEEDKRGRLMSLYTMAFAGGRAFWQLVGRHAVDPRRRTGHAHHRRLCVPGRRGLVRAAVAATAGVGPADLQPKGHSPGCGLWFVGRKRNHFGHAGRVTVVMLPMTVNVRP